MDKPTRALAGLVVAAAALVANDVRSETVDPSLPVVVAIGVAKSSAPFDRLGLTRTGRSHVRLPTHPVEIGRRAVGTIGQVPIVHPDGTLIVALQSPEIVRVAADGTESGRARLGPSAAVRPPVILPNGGVAVFTSAPSVVFLSDTLKVQSTVPLPKGTFATQTGPGDMFDAFASIIPSADGGVFIASNRAIVQVDSSGRTLGKFTLPERVGSDLLPHPDGLLAVGEFGNVYLLHPPSDPKHLGALGPVALGSAALLDDRTLVALSAPNRVVSFDLKSKTVVTRIGDNPFSYFDSSPAYDSEGNAWMTSFEGFLVSFDPAGVELARSAADRDANLTAQWRPRMNPGSGRPSVMVDDDDNVAFLRSSGRFGVRASDGTVTMGTERACLTAIAMVPTSDDHLVIACREGTLLFFQDASVNAPSTTPSP
ncbi:MAG: hypothetical protein U0271_01660 [Polyangiaceae bacterium]